MSLTVAMLIASGISAATSIGSGIMQSRSDRDAVEKQNDLSLRQKELSDINYDREFKRANRASTFSQSMDKNRLSLAQDDMAHAESESERAKMNTIVDFAGKGTERNAQRLATNLSRRMQ